MTAVIAFTKVGVNEYPPRHQHPHPSVMLTDPMHQVAADALDLLGKSGERLVIVPQNLYEFWVVATRPVAQNGLGMSAAQAEAELAKFQQLFTVLDDTKDILPEWERLVTHFGVLGKNAHDARLVAAMNVHRVDRILTFNLQDFQRYPGIVAVSPNQIVQPTP